MWAARLLNQLLGDHGLRAWVKPLQGGAFGGRVVAYQGISMLMESTRSTRPSAVVLLFSFRGSCWQGSVAIRQMWHMGQGHLGWVFFFFFFLASPPYLSARTFYQPVFDKDWAPLKDRTETLSSIKIRGKGPKRKRDE